MRRAAGALIAAMTPGLGALVGALALALVAGTVWRLTNGRMRGPRAPRSGRARAGASQPLSARVLQGAGLAGSLTDGDGPLPDLAGPADLVAASSPVDAIPAATVPAATVPAATVPAATVPAAAVPAATVPAASVPAERGILTSDQLGHALGERATLVQFSSAFCAPCRATRRILADVAGMTDGVSHIEIDAESRLDLVRQLNVLRTPTVFVLGEGGRIVRRASGQPRKPDVIAAIGVAVEPQ
jgi:thiol-disulfide isomerase/thioredoxin